MRLLCTIIALFLLSFSQGTAQWALGPVGGFDLGAKSNVVGGIAYAYPMRHAHGQRIGEAGISLAAGYGIYDPHLFMPQVGVWLGAIFCVGFKVVVCTDFDRTSVVAVP